MIIQNEKQISVLTEYFKKRVSFLRIVVLGTIVSFLFLTFFNLGANALWNDEAEVALVALRVIKTGIPTVITSEGVVPIGRDSNFYFNFPPYLYRLQTWLMFYLAAISMKLFGQSELGIRLIFAIIGAGAIIIYFKISKVLFKKNFERYITLTSILLSTQYIILIRQARYYSPTIFLSLLSTYSLIKTEIIGSSQKIWHILYLIGMILLFHTHYLSFYFIFASHFIYYLSQNKISILKRKLFIYPGLLHSFGIILLSVIPWTFFFRQGFENPVDYMSAFPSLWTQLLTLLLHINRQVPLILIFISIKIILKNLKNANKRQKQTYFLLGITIICSILGIAFLGSLQIPPSINADFRYILPIFPLLLLIAGVSITFLFNKNKILGIIVFLVFLCTNLLSIPIEKLLTETYWPFPYSRFTPRSYLLEYSKFEIQKKYIGPVDAIVSYLKTHAKDEEKIFVSSEANSLFFSLQKLHIENNHSFETKHNKPFLPKDLIAYDWVIFRMACDINCMFSQEALDVQQILENNFTAIELPIYDYLVQNREEIPYHLFKTHNNKPHIVIYKNNMTEFD